MSYGSTGTSPIIMGWRVRSWFQDPYPLMNVNEYISNKKSDNDLAKEYHLAGIYATICTMCCTNVSDIIWI